MGDSILGKTLGQLGDIATQAGKQTVNLPRQMIEEAGDEVKGSVDQKSKHNKEESSHAKVSEGKEETKKIVESFYGSSNKNQVNDSEFEKMIAGKSPEDQQKLRQLRKILHEQYYQQLVNKSKNSQAEKEERPAEKVEKEKMKDLHELQQKEAQKPPPLAAQRARERVEKFPGASG